MKNEKSLDIMKKMNIIYGMGIKYMMKKKSLEQFMSSIDAGRTTVYYYVTAFLDELVERGCVEVRQVVQKRRIYILDEDCVLHTLEEHGVIFRKKSEK